MFGLKYSSHFPEFLLTNLFIRLKPKISKPLLIVIVQLILLTSLWTFYAITRIQPIALPLTLAQAYYDEPKTFTFVVTLISSGMSIVTAYLYSLAIQHLLTMALHNPISLFAMSSGIAVGGRAPIMNFGNPMWTITSTVCVIALGAQTAGWATLLAPQPIQLEFHIEGSELDLSNPSFWEVAFGASTTPIVGFIQGLIFSLQCVGLLAVTPSRLAPSHTRYRAVRRTPTFTDVILNSVPLMQTSGVSSIYASLGSPTILNYNKVSFLGRTGGILPATLYNMSSPIHTSDMLPTTAAILDPPNIIPSGTARNYTIIQQGFTANISCKIVEDLSQISPVITTINLTAPDAEPDAPPTAVHVFYGVQCPDNADLVNSSSALGYPSENGTLSTVFSAFCVLEMDTSVPDSPVLETLAFIQGTGSYDWIPLTSCTIMPYIMSQSVTYTAQMGISDSSASDLGNLQEWPSYINMGSQSNEQQLPTFGVVPVLLLQITFALSQNILTDVIGDSLSKFRTTANTSTLLEAYLSGVFELGATLLRTSFSESGNPFRSADEFTTSLNGTFVVETIGWKQQARDIPVSLIAPTAILLLSIAVVVFTRIRFPNSYENQNRFDPGNVSHIIRAAGGFIGVKGPDWAADGYEQIKTEKKLTIQLAPQDEGKELRFVIDSAEGSEPLMRQHN
ncbi:hypothetical protein BDN72DRAFT_902668 [Pluteus cervinus]|uniref:Uncharacterized protein n=1 Tax=Pluteus cervinus TaxID=181527 RepID=A0ACD3AE40_9AGAR|nr:hypothetical protein BDN72DRAFT_902668 [Pluteus cervinus]